jgi:hypothetical protein
MNDNVFMIPEDVSVTTYAGAIDVYENIFSEEISAKIISIAKEADEIPSCPIKYSQAMIGDGEHGGSYRSNVSMSLISHSEECPCQINEALHFIKEKLSLFVRHYSLKYDVEIAFDEGLQLLKYSPGKQYKVHTDYGPGPASSRVLSGLIYLNPKKYLGGGTHFVNFNETINPSYPSIALFPSNYAYRHSARPVFEGNKYVIVTWFGPPWEVGKI